MAQLLKAAGSAELYYAINNLSIIVLIAGLSLESGITFYLSKKLYPEGELVSLSLFWSLIAGILITGIFLWQPDWASFTAQLFSRPLFIFMFVAGNLLITYFSACFYGRKQFFFPHLLPALINFGLAIFYGWLLLTGTSITIPASLLIYFTGYMASGVLLLLVFFIRYPGSSPVRIPSGATITGLLRYSGMALVANLVAFLAYRVDYWLLKSFPGIIDETALGNYIQVSKLVQLFLFAPTVVATVVFPFIASRQAGEFDKETRQITIRVLLLNILACSVLSIVGRWIFPWLFGKSFSFMYSCFLFSIPAILAISVIRILASFFAGVNKIIYNLTGSLIALVTIILLNLWLIPLMGINGSAIADSSGYLLYLAYLLIRRRNYGKEKKEYRLAD